MICVSEGCGARTAGTPIGPLHIDAQSGLAGVFVGVEMPFHGATAERELWHGTRSQCGATTQPELLTSDGDFRRNSS
jgi:hypothetical protein